MGLMIVLAVLLPERQGFELCWEVVLGPGCGVWIECCISVTLVKMFNGVRTLGTAHSTGHHSQWFMITELVHFYVITVHTY